FSTTGSSLLRANSRRPHARRCPYHSGEHHLCVSREGDFPFAGSVRSHEPLAGNPRRYRRNTGRHLQRAASLENQVNMQPALPRLMPRVKKSLGLKIPSVRRSLLGVRLLKTLTAALLVLVWLP